MECLLICDRIDGKPNTDLRSWKSLSPRGGEVVFVLKLSFTVDGPARLLGVENGDLNSPATGKDGVRKAHHGRGLAILQSTGEPGKVRVTALAEGLEAATVEIETKP